LEQREVFGVPSSWKRKGQIYLAQRGLLMKLYRAGDNEFEIKWVNYIQNFWSIPKSTPKPISGVDLFDFLKTGNPTVVYFSDMSFILWGVRVKYKIMDHYFEIKCSQFSRFMEIIENVANNKNWLKEGF
jgi:hypothetical protein